MRRECALVATCVAVISLAVVSAGQGGMPQGPRPGMVPGAPGQVGAASASATGLILGQVVDAETGAPIAGISVRLAGGPAVALSVAIGAAPPPPTSLTNGQGYFLFRDLAKSSYTLSVQAPGYLPSSYGLRRADGGPSRSIDVADGQRVTGAIIRLWKSGVITGRVVDELGEPVVGVNVRAARRDANGRLTMGQPSSTDDRGIYRISGLVPGDFFVLVTSTVSALPASVAESLQMPTGALRMDLFRDVPAIGFGAANGIPVGDMVVMAASGMGGVLMAPRSTDGRVSAYPTTFHPSAATPQGATTVRVTSGAERGGVDLQLRLVPMFRVSGVVEGPTGPMPNMGIRLLPAFGAAFANESNFETAVTATGPDGRFSFMGVPSGQFEVAALRLPRQTNSGATQTIVTLDGGGGMVSFGTAAPTLPPASTDPTLWARAAVDVAGRDVTGVVVTLRSGSRLRGQVIFDGAAPPPPAERPRFSVSLIPSDDRQRQSPLPAPIDADLKFSTAEYPGGRYLVSVGSVPPGWTVTEARVGDVNALVTPITLTGGDLDDVVITLTNRTIRLSGHVRAATGADPNAVVVAFPAEHRRWIESGMASRHTRTVDVRPDGAYEITGLVPGTYAVVAVPASSAVDTRDPAMIEMLARSAVRVTIEAGDQKTQALSVSQIR